MDTIARTASGQCGAASTGSAAIVSTPAPLLVLRCVRGLGPVGFRQALTAANGSTEGAVGALPSGTRAEAEDRARAALRRAADTGLVMIGWDDPVYPDALRSLEDPPPVLFVQGNVRLFERPAVALVGTRKATSYGLRITHVLAVAAGSAGVTIVSGLARGIDARAHEVALATPGRTIAVMGTGADVAYPRENTVLHTRIASEGLVVSELLPGAPPHAGSFPRRNRLVAALADVTVVVEAGVRSGALITANIADALGRVVGAVPGPIDVTTAQGSNQLLRDGRHVITEADDVLTLITLTPRGRLVTRRDALESLQPVSAEEAATLTALRDAPRLADDLLSITRLNPSRLAAALGSLTDQGLIEQDATGWLRCTNAGVRK